MLAFRCSRTRMYFPEDYVEEWGKKYGIGLGSVPISEALTNNYGIGIAESSDAKTTMHPVGVCRSQVDLVDIPESEYNARKAIIASDDPNMVERSRVMRDRQLLHSTAMQRQFAQESAVIIEAEKAKQAGVKTVSSTRR